MRVRCSKAFRLLSYAYKIVFCGHFKAPESRRTNRPFSQLMPGLETGHPVTVGQSPAHDSHSEQSETETRKTAFSSTETLKSFAGDWPTVTDAPVSNSGNNCANGLFHAGKEFALSSCWEALSLRNRTRSIQARYSRDQLQLHKIAPAARGQYAYALGWSVMVDCLCLTTLTYTRPWNTRNSSWERIFFGAPHPHASGWSTIRMYTGSGPQEQSKLRVRLFGRPAS